MESLTGEVLEQTLRVASGERTKGELAGHSQVSIWRDWAVGEGSRGAAPARGPATPPRQPSRSPTRRRWTGTRRAATAGTAGSRRRRGL